MFVAATTISRGDEHRRIIMWRQKQIRPVSAEEHDEGQILLSRALAADRTSFLVSNLTYICIRYMGILYSTDVNVRDLINLEIAPRDGKGPARQIPNLTMVLCVGHVP